MIDYLDIKERKDVTVKKMFEIYKTDNKYRNRITWDAHYLITGWKHIQQTKVQKILSNYHKGLEMINKEYND